MLKDIHRRNTIPILITLIAIVVLICVPNKFSQKIYENTERVSARVLSTDESFIINNGLIKTGEQLCEVEILQGSLKEKLLQEAIDYRGLLNRIKYLQLGIRFL